MPRIGLLLLVLTTLAACTKDPQPEITCLPGSLSTGVLAFYPFDGGSLLDASGQGRDLDNPTTAQPTTDRTGNPQCAYRFNNMVDTEFLQAGSPNWLNNLDLFSISLWVRPATSNRGAGDYEGLVQRGDNPNCPDRRGDWSIGLYDCRRPVMGHRNSVWSFRQSPGSCADEILANSGNWFHLAATVDAVNDIFRIYRNGVLEAEEMGVATCFQPATFLEQDDLLIGRRFHGDLDDIILYQRLLSATEVAQLATLPPCCP